MCGLDLMPFLLSNEKDTVSTDINLKELAESVSYRLVDPGLFLVGFRGPYSILEKFSISGLSEN